MTGGAARRLARGTSLNVAGGVVSGLCGFLTTLLIARLLPLGEAGAVFVAIATVTILNRVYLFGADTGLVRYVPRLLARRQGARVPQLLVVALAPVVVLSVAVSAVLAANAGQLEGVLAGTHRDEFLSAFRILVWAAPVSSLSDGLLAATRAFATMRPTFFVDRVLRSGLQVVAIAVLPLAFGRSPAAVAAGWTVGYAVSACAGAVVLARMLRRQVPRPWAPVRRDAAALAGSFWRFSAPRSVASVLQVGIDRLDVFLVSVLASLSAAGIYAAALRFLVVARMFTAAGGQALQPLIAGAFARRDRVDAHRLYKASAAISVTFAWPLILALTAYAPALLLVLGPRYTAGATALSIVSAATLFGTLMGPTDTVLLMAGRTWWSLANTAATLAVNVGLNLLLIPSHGITGAAWAWAVSIGVGNTLPTWQLYARLRINPFSRLGGITGAAALACYGGPALVARGVLHVGVAGSVVAVAASTAAYGVVLYVLRERLRDLLGAARRGGPLRAADGPAELPTARPEPGIRPITSRARRPASSP